MIAPSRGVPLLLCSKSHELHSIDVSFGNIPCRFETTNRHWARFLSKKYAPFLTHFRKPTHRYILSLNDTNSQCIHRINLSQSQATIFIPSDCRSFRTFNSDVKMVFATLLLRDNGIVLHASCLQHNGYGYIFVGPSGAGKSTVVRLAPKGILMGDDTAIIRRHKHKYLLYWSPFYEKNPIIKRNAFVPLVGIYSLHKAKNNRLIRATDVVNILRHAWVLPPNQVKPKEQTQITTSFWNVALDVAAQIPLYHLYFTKDSSFWHLLEN